MEQDSEMMRLQILGDPDLMRQLREVRFLSSNIILFFILFILGLDAARARGRGTVQSHALRRTAEADARAASLRRDGAAT